LVAIPLPTWISVKINCGSIVLLPISNSSSLLLNFYLFFTTSKASDPSAFYFPDGIAKSLAARIEFVRIYCYCPSRGGNLGRNCPDCPSARDESLDPQ
jgi:hypothetical protein